jgi:hypothetical protein
MWVTTYFNNFSNPVTGLSPVVKIRELETGDVVTSGTMSEVGQGFYKYDFSQYDITKDYLILCDAVTLANEFRYKAVATGEYGPLIHDINLISDDVDLRVALIRKIMMNRHELDDGGNLNLVLYEDDSLTPLLKWNVTDPSWQAIDSRRHMPSKRSRGV